MPRVFHSCVSCVVVLGVASLLGCSKEDPNLPHRVPVHVSVTYQNKPVEDAQVTFVPEPSGKPAFGRTDAQGQVDLSTFRERDGAVPGSYQVTIIKTATNAAAVGASQPQAGMGATPPVAAKYLVPQKYSQAQTSGLQAIVKQSGENKFEFSLKD